jgi:Na+/melibiose symporter-like transporter
VDLIEWKDGRRLDSLVSTADNLASKLATAGATLLITATLKANGFNADLGAQPDSAIRALCAILGWVPMLLCGVMLVVVLFLNIERDTKKMLEEKAVKGL